MTAPPIRDLARGWLRAQSLAEGEADAEIDRLATMTDAEYDKAAAALPTPMGVPSVDALLRRAAGDRAPGASSGVRAAAVFARSLRSRPSFWIGFAVAAVAAVAVLAWKGPEVVAWMREPTILPDREAVESPASRAERRAGQLRQGALRACQTGQYDECERQLDEAKQIAPAGEADSRVVAARNAILQARAHGEPTPEKERTQH